MLYFRVQIVNGPASGSFSKRCCSLYDAVHAILVKFFFFYILARFSRSAPKLNERDSRRRPNG